MAKLRLSEEQRENLLLRQDLAEKEKALALMTRELESLSYGISHDLRSPLRHLIGFSGALIEDYGDTLEPTAQSYLQCIARAAGKLELLVEGLLKLSRVTRQELVPASVDLSQLARDAISSLRHSAPEREVVFTVEDGLVVRGDFTLMKTVIDNLLDNAWKFTSKKGSGKIEFGRKLQEGESVFFLRDDGAGFDMRYADKLFAPLQRMHKETDFEGIGIGLATAQKIIRRHGGRIWADAEVDAGATFYFTFAD